MERSRYGASRKELPPELMPCEPWSANSEPAPVWNAYADTPAAAPRDDPTQWLARTIETEIIPRLMLAHRLPRRESVVLEFPRAAIVSPGPREADVVELAQLVLERSAQPSLVFVLAMRDTGVPLEAIYLDLLAPAARRLGELWEADLCPFADVTIGLWRLQQVMRELGESSDADLSGQASMRRALLAPVPGSQHTMGLFMVAQFFRNAGWDVWGDAAISADEIIAATRSRWFDLIGFSVGSETHVERLASVILDVRNASRNQNLVVVVGGPIILANPALVAQLGADGTATDAAEAVRQAERLVSARAVQG